MVSGNQSAARVRCLPTGCSISNCPPALFPLATTFAVKSNVPNREPSLAFQSLCKFGIKVRADVVASVLDGEKQIVANQEAPPIVSTVVAFPLQRERRRAWEGPGEAIPLRFIPSSIPLPIPATTLGVYAPLLASQR